MENIQQIEQIIREIEAAADPGTKAAVRQLVSGILELHSEAFNRIVELSGGPLVRTFARDERISSLLLLYGLHPDPVETRVQRALDRMQGVELLGIADGIVRVKSTLPRESVEQAIYTAAPEIEAVEIDGPPQLASFVPLEALLSR